MAKHASQQSAFKKTVGVAGVTALALSPMVASANGGGGECQTLLDSNFDGDSYDIQTLPGGICELVVTDLGDGFSMGLLTVPAGVTKLAAVLVGAGGGAWNNYFPGGYDIAGGGGQLTYVEFDQSNMPSNMLISAQYESFIATDITDLNVPDFEDLYFALPGATIIDEDYYGGSFGNGRDSKVTLAEWGDAFFGVDGIYGTGDDIESNPWSVEPFLASKIGNGQRNLWDFANTNDNYFSGHGANGRGDSSNNLQALTGGDGMTLSEVTSRYNGDSTLWSPESQMSGIELGEGGSVYLSENLLSQPQFGMGASIYTDGGPNFQTNSTFGFGFGGAAVVIIRFALPGQASYFPPGGATYQGPVEAIYPTSGPAGGTARISGDRLDSITKITIGGQNATFTLNADGSVRISIPRLAPGLYDIQYQIGNSLTLVGKFKVEKSKLTPVGGKFMVNKLFANFAGDNPLVPNANSSAIVEFLADHPGATHVTCVGLTSGIPALPSDLALAELRAKNACDVVRKNLPGVKVKELTKVGAGVGSDYRGVRIYVRGSN